MCIREESESKQEEVEERDLGRGPKTRTGLGLTNTTGLGSGWAEWFDSLRKRKNAKNRLTSRIEKIRRTEWERYARRDTNEKSTYAGTEERERDRDRGGIKQLKERDWPFFSDDGQWWSQPHECITMGTKIMCMWETARESTERKRSAERTKTEGRKVKETNPLPNTYTHAPSLSHSRHHGDTVIYYSPAGTHVGGVVISHPP